MSAMRAAFYISCGIFWYFLVFFSVFMIGIVLSGCLRLPVTVHPDYTADGEPIALPTAPTGISRSADGAITAYNPNLPSPSISNYHPEPASAIDFNAIINLIMLFLGGGGIAAGAVMRQRARRAEANEDEVYADLQQSNRARIANKDAI